VSMKNKLFRIALVAVGIACCAIIISCVCQSPSPGGEDKVVFGEDSIFIPGTAITKDDQKAMNDVLAQYKTSLYRVETYQDGARAQTRGTLPEATIGEPAVSKARANAKLRHLDGSAIQVGFRIGTTHHVTPTPGAHIGTSHHVTPTPGAHIGTSHHVTPTPGAQVNAPSDEDYEEAAALVNRLKPILKKYSQE
jgi:acetyltransferase-like isoleucine patch superfamily enzyme